MNLYGLPVIFLGLVISLCPLVHSTFLQSKCSNWVPKVILPAAFVSLSYINFKVNNQNLLMCTASASISSNILFFQNGECNFGTISEAEYDAIVEFVPPIGNIIYVIKQLAERKTSYNRALVTQANGVYIEMNILSANHTLSVPNFNMIPTNCPSVTSTGVTAIRQNTVYVCGDTTSCYSLTAGSNAWADLPDLPVARLPVYTSASYTLDIPVISGSIWVMGPQFPAELIFYCLLSMLDDLYIIGGKGPTLIPEKLCYKLSENEISWENISDMKIARSDFSCSVMNWKGDQKRIIVAGGRITATLLTDTIEVYNPNSNSWTKLLNPKLPFAARTLSPGIAFDSFYYIMGYGQDHLVFNYIAGEKLPITAMTRSTIFTTL